MEADVLKSEYKRQPNKLDSLQMLKKLGVKFGCIFDVGVHESTFELISAFPDIKHYLFEPADQYIPIIAENYKNIEHEVINVAVSDRDGKGQLKLIRLASDAVTHSSVLETDSGSSSEEDTVDIELLKLSTLLNQRNFPGPILLKIDVDGHEPAILDGLVGGEDKIGAVIIEAVLGHFGERIQKLKELGFILWDFVDPCYYKGCLSQMDLVFIKPELAEEANLQPWSRPEDFEWTSWQHTL